MNRADRRIRVSLLEPEGLTRELIRACLGEANIEVVRSMGHVESFVSYLSGDRPDGAVVDLQTPEPPYSPKLDTLRELKEKYPAIPVIVLGRFAEPSVETCYQEGAAAWVNLSSASPDELTQAVINACGGVRFFPLTMARAALGPQPLAPANPLIDQLTVRERQVLSFIGEGSDNLKISAHLDIGERTVKSHVTSLYRKTGRENRTQLALLARELGLRPKLEPPPPSMASPPQQPLPLEMSSNSIVG